MDKGILFHRILPLKCTELSQRRNNLTANKNSLEPFLKSAVPDMRHFARVKFFRSLVHKKDFSFIWEVLFRLGYVFCQER